MPADKADILKTSADDLFELVKKKKKISVEEAAKLLGLPQPTVQALADFLVEEKIFGLEYKFTTPYVYLSKEEAEKKPLKIAQKISFARKLATKEDFYEKAKRRMISHEKIQDLWKKYLNENLDYLKEEFYKKAKIRNISEEKIGALWRKYLSYLV